MQRFHFIKSGSFWEHGNGAKRHFKINVSVYLMLPIDMIYFTSIQAIWESEGVNEPDIQC